MTSTRPPVIIIGAGRSGTNMLRDILVRLPGYETWPCDEINYIWRHGNRGFATDQFTPEMATPKIAGYIRRQFDKFAAKTSAETVVEKTCANSLRCSFVNAVVPDARFIHIIRDGRDVAYSATQRWTAKLDLGYIAKKARYVPLTDVPFYGGKYFANRVGRLLSREGRLSVWGPKFDGMKEVFENHSTAVACAIQWQVCVQAATIQLAGLESHRVMSLRYEDFTANPETHLTKICEFLGSATDGLNLETVIGKVSRKSVGQGSKRLDPHDVQGIQTHAGKTLHELGYV